jgi:hypothetical protein
MAAQNTALWSLFPWKHLHRENEMISNICLNGNILHKVMLSFPLKFMFIWFGILVFLVVLVNLFMEVWLLKRLI